MEENPLYQRIKQRLVELGMSERQASIEAVGNSQFIRNIRKGTSTSPRADNIIKLAKVLNVSESWLMGVADDMGQPASEQVFGIRNGGIVEAGTFRLANSLNQDEELRLVPIPADPRYPHAAQFAFQVVGDSMTEAKIFEGMYVVAVELHAWEHLHGEPADGKLVIVARTRNGDPERELTVKRLRIFRDRLELQPESRNPTWQPLVFPNPPSHDDQVEAQIIAVVISSTWVYA